MRKTWVQINGVLYEKGAEPIPDPVAPMVMGDIQPYRSMATGQEIGGRRQHREHLQRHGLVEVGNERLTASKPKQDRTENKRTIAAILDQRYHKAFR